MECLVLPFEKGKELDEPQSGADVGHAVDASVNIKSNPLESGGLPFRRFENLHELLKDEVRPDGRLGQHFKDRFCYRAFHSKFYGASVVSFSRHAEEVIVNHVRGGNVGIRIS